MSELEVLELSDDEHFDDELLVRNFEEEAQLLKHNLLPAKSKEKYIQAYDQFMKWKNDNKASFDENVFLVYFDELSQTLKPPSLWSRWSKLKAVLNLRHEIDIEPYKHLKKYLKEKNKGYVPKKSKVLSLAYINSFIESTKDEEFLSYKAIAIIGFFGCLRCQDILNLKLSDLEDTGKHYIITVTESKTETTRNFVISDKYYQLVKHYRNLRPKEFSAKDRFFVCYQNGKCTRQFIGKNKISDIPNIIAAKLDLPDPELYTGHCFRRSSATALSNAGGDLVLVKQHGGWKSDAVAQGYIDLSTARRQQIFNMICNNVSNDSSDANTSHFLKHPPIKNLFNSSGTGKKNQDTRIAFEKIANEASIPLKRNITTEPESDFNIPSTSNQLMHVLKTQLSTDSNHMRNMSADNLSNKENVSTNSFNESSTLTSNNNVENSLINNASNSFCADDEELLNTALDEIENGNSTKHENKNKRDSSALGGIEEDSTMHKEKKKSDSDALDKIEEENSTVHDKRKLDSNSSHIPKKAKPSFKKTEFDQDMSKVLIQNCEIHAITINNNYNYSCKDE